VEHFPCRLYPRVLCGSSWGSVCNPVRFSDLVERSRFSHVGQGNLGQVGEVRDDEEDAAVEILYSAVGGHIQQIGADRQINPVKSLLTTKAVGQKS
jgi:hypothetical protein